MSAIGDYVHYNSSNYKLWGITRPKEYSAASHYNGSLANYIINKRNLNSVTTEFNYSELEQNLQKNTLANLMRDQQLVNLDYGQKINQFRSMIIARAEGKEATAYRGNLSKKSKEALLKQKESFDILQKNIETINRLISQGKTVPREWLEKVTAHYQKLQSSEGRTSILGGIQQGLNDQAARVWEKTLNGTLGKKIDEFTQDSARVYVEKQLKDNITSSGNMTVQVDVSNRKHTVYQTSDETDSTYAIVATEEGWEIETKQNRTNILKGSLQNIYAKDANPKTFTLGGQIPLMKVLTILENEDNFSTHWLNRHANQLDSSLDSGLKTAIIYETITQNRKKSSLTEDFIYIDRATGQIKHQNFWSIIEMAKFDIQPNLTHHKFANDWAPPEEHSYKGSIARINNLLTQVHSINMIVASKPISI